MFKAAKAGPQKAITANRLVDGLVVFLANEGAWTLDIATARVFDEGADLDAALAYGQAQHDARVIIEPYAIDVAPNDAGGPVPVRLRERIRAERGPTVAYGDAERAKLAEADSDKARRAAGPTG